MSCVQSKASFPSKVNEPKKGKKSDILKAMQSFQKGESKQRTLDHLRKFYTELHDKLQLKFSINMAVGLEYRLMCENRDNFFLDSLQETRQVLYEAVFKKDRHCFAKPALITVFIWRYFKHFENESLTLFEKKILQSVLKIHKSMLRCIALNMPLNIGCFYFEAKLPPNLNKFWPSRKEIFYSTKDSISQQIRKKYPQQVENGKINLEEVSQLQLKMFTYIRNKCFFETIVEFIKTIRSVLSGLPAEKFKKIAFLEAFYYKYFQVIPADEKMTISEKFLFYNLLLMRNYLLKNL